MNSKKRLVVACCGNAIECYDYFLYVLLAPVLTKLFFPSDLANALLYLLIIFAIGFLVRPFGSLLWGYIGDKHGRKPVFLATILLMSVASFAITFIPTYESIGVLAPTLLLIIRIIQGIAYSGEVPTFSTYLYEIAPENKKGFYSSFVTFASLSGVLFATMLYLLLETFFSPNAIHAGMWRIPFFFSVIAILLIGYFRYGLVETLGQKVKIKNPIVEAFKYNWKEIVLIFLFISVGQIYFDSYAVYTLIYLSKHLSIDYSQSLIISSMSIVFVLVFLPLAGAIGDRIGIKKLMFFSIAGVALTNTLVYYCLKNSTTLYQILLVQLLNGFIAAALLSVLPAFLLSKTPQRTRVSIYAISLNLSVALLGGTVPIVHEFLISLTGSKLAPALYVTTFAFVSLFIMRYMKSDRSS